VKRVSQFVAALAISTLALGSIALAHAHYASSTPAPGQTLAASPASVLITYDSELGAGSTGTVTNASGATVSTGAAIDANDRTKLTIALSPSLPNGVYKVSWHSVSADDGDELDGTFFFGVGVPAPSTATAPNPAGIALLVAGLAILATSFALLPRRLAPR
jgi:methionine-rich copper-binding protein CopC